MELARCFRILKKPPSAGMLRPFVGGDLRATGRWRPAGDVGGANKTEPGLMFSQSSAVTQEPTGT